MDEHYERRACSRACAAQLPKLSTPFRTPDSTKAERVRANGLINKRVKLGHVVKPDRCTACATAGKRLDSHHEDYGKPDEVYWLCRSCHMKAHNRPGFLRGIQPMRTGAVRRARPAAPAPAPAGRREA